MARLIAAELQAVCGKKNTVTMRKDQMFSRSEICRKVGCLTDPDACELMKAAFEKEMREKSEESSIMHNGFDGELPIHEDSFTCPKCQSYHIVGVGSGNSEIETETCLDCGYEWGVRMPEIEDDEEEGE
jgi:predicted RNA-binding Zn-ribbon protein involved in translation (DUF1610 family)